MNMPHHVGQISRRLMAKTEFVRKLPQTLRGNSRSSSPLSFGCSFVLVGSPLAQAWTLHDSVGWKDCNSYENAPTTDLHNSFQ